MHDYPLHTIESAPDKSKPALTGLKQSFGLIPNLAAIMANSPVLLDSFVGAFMNFHGGSFTAAQRQVLLLSNAVANRSAWAVAFHSTLALKEGVDADAVRAIRDRRAPKDQTLAALSTLTLTQTLVEKRGHLTQRDLNGLAAVGIGPEQVLEIIAGLAISLMANYTGNLSHPPLEAPFQGQIWSAEGNSALT
jgi:alkylhydroperoxidase family enzyme